MYRGTAYNCVISENETIGQHADGAGIFIENAAFYNNTIVKNSSNATTRGNGGICIWTSGASSQLTIYNCIVLDNSGITGDMTGTGDIAVSSNGGYINCNYSITSDVTNASRGNGAVTYNNSVVEGTDIFADYDVTIVNFWNNGCGTCIAEMPELEEMYQKFQKDNINLIGVGADSGENEEQLELAKNILEEKGVTYQNISPNPEHDFYKDFIADITGYPTTYVVDSEGNIIGAPLIGNVKGQIDTLQSRIDQIRDSE